MATAFQRDTHVRADESYTQTGGMGPMARAVRDARYIMRFVFTVAPIIAGLDKIYYGLTDKWLLVDWYQYLWPGIKSMGVTNDMFAWVVGIVEVVAGLVVAFRPDFGGYLVMAWLWGIIVNLLLIPGYYDIALRDFGLSLGALSMARLWWPRYHDLALTNSDRVGEVHTREYAAPPSGA